MMRFDQNRQPAGRLVNDDVPPHALDAYLANLERRLEAADAAGRAVVRAAAAWDATLSEYCDGPERDAVRAVLATDTARGWLEREA